MPRSLAASARVPARSMASRRSALPGPEASSWPWRMRSRGRKVLMDIPGRGYREKKRGPRRTPVSIGPLRSGLVQVVDAVAVVRRDAGGTVVAGGNRGEHRGARDAAVA